MYGYRVRSAYILEYTPPLGEGGISAIAILWEKYEKENRKGLEMRKKGE
jgi:hypothetical protein